MIAEGTSTLNTSALTGESLPREASSRRRSYQRLYQHDRRAENPDHKGVWRIHGIEDPGSGGKCQLQKIQIRELYFQICKILYAGGLLRRPGAGNFTAPCAAAVSWDCHRNGATGSIRALTFLVISCPCALVISIPLSFFAGIGGASNAGVLVKGSNYLETLSQTKYVVFDKTGTMTQGVFEVSGVHH